MDKSSILKQVSIEYFIFPAKVVQDPSVIAHCRSSYHAHPYGCPNWGFKVGCPPRIASFLSIYRPTVLVAIAQLDFGEYLRLKAGIHPDWTERALKNPRHWQGHLRAALKRYLSSDKVPDGFTIVTNPEAMGIDLFQTCANFGFILERDPRNKVCQINILARLKKK